MRTSLARTPFTVTASCVALLALTDCGGKSQLDLPGADAGLGAAGAGASVGGVGGVGGSGTSIGGSAPGGSPGVGGIGVGGQAGFAAGGGTGGCGPTACPEPMLPIPGIAEACCTAGGRCGFRVSLLGPECIESGQPGPLDPDCPDATLMGFAFPGCCKPGNRCGVRDDLLGLGCVDPSVFGQPSSTDCDGNPGGTGGFGGDAGFGGFGFGGSTAGFGGDAGFGGFGGSSAGAGGFAGIGGSSAGAGGFAGSGGSSAGTGGAAGGGGAGATDPGQKTCGTSTPVVCSSNERCCVLDPGIDYCETTGTPCACTQPGCDVTPVSCDGPEDCPSGQTCCGTFSFLQQRYLNLRCVGSCGAPNEREICRPGQACSNASETCTNSPFLPSNLFRCN